MKQSVRIGGEFFIKEPLEATVTLSRPGDATPLLVLPGRVIRPGDTLQFEYAPAGIKIELH